jgi:hypothetical protein
VQSQRGDVLALSDDVKKPRGLDFSGLDDDDFLDFFFGFESSRKPSFSRFDSRAA